MYVMYTPHAFRFQDDQEMIRFIQQYSFATMVTCLDTIPVATQLPFLVEDRTDKLLLSSHFAVANDQAKHIVNDTSLIIFTEPHAYISPQHYDKKESVPTWDYIAVHAYGKARLLTDDRSKIQLLERMIHYYDPVYMHQWKELSDTFKSRMIKGIVAFEMEVTQLQGQKKLSQNKTVAEREKIAVHLANSPNQVEKSLASFIKDTL